MIKILERSTIETKPLQYNYQENPDKVAADKSTDPNAIPFQKSDEAVKFESEQVGRYPLVYIDGVQIENSNIRILKILNDSYMPELEMEFSDPTSTLVDDKYPTDNTIISVFKKSTSTSYMSIKMDFKITKFTIIKGTKGDSLSFKLTAVLNIDDLYLMNYESYRGTSFDVLRKMSKEMKLGFATNINNTSDSMTWINPNNYKINFIQDIIQKSYISDDTFLFGYIDFFYNFNYVDIEKQVKDDISQQMNVGDREATIQDGKSDELPLILTNNSDKAETNMYIEKYTVENASTDINLSYGYRDRLCWYNKTEDKINRYLLDSITDSGDNDNIILKGNSGNTKGLYEDLINEDWIGKSDLDNVYDNYLHTSIQNRNNLKFLQKLRLVIRLPKPNYGLYRFQKVLLELYNFGKMENKEEQYGQKPEIISDDGQYDNKIINKLSGEWLITAINFNFSQKDSNYQEITLIKRELTSKYTFPRRSNSKMSDGTPQPRNINEYPGVK